MRKLGGPTARNAEPVDPAIRTTHLCQCSSYAVYCSKITSRAPGPDVSATVLRDVLVVQEDVVEHSIGVAGRLDVEFIEAVFEDTDGIEVGVGVEDEVVKACIAHGEFHCSSLRT